MVSDVRTTTEIVASANPQLPSRDLLDGAAGLGFYGLIDGAKAVGVEALLSEDGVRPARMGKDVKASEPQRSGDIEVDENSVVWTLRQQPMRGAILR